MVAKQVKLTISQAIEKARDFRDEVDRRAVHTAKEKYPPETHFFWYRKGSQMVQAKKVKQLATKIRRHEACLEPWDSETDDSDAEA